ncbi:MULTISPECIES: hypothetical protein [unclassified Streptomyces]|uniref:hypothetical protein n=1 Tax=unclassified Streptomyces TaxID=2593676 RepID=UPI00224D2461|nr:MULTISPECIES: hypothetical protein [unclassified Streptomyces]MCX4650256.1 hypothetical protein [Streptomyces sp. NBC_01446]MCX5327747.1 hypothetical protein [Streptomyces sp. NBC_00120]
MADDKVVVVRGGITATASKAAQPNELVEGANSGKWTAGEVKEVASSTLSVGGAFVLHEATCEFGFSGANSSGVAVVGASTVTLQASNRRLRADGRGVLLDGDTAKDKYGNTLAASSTGPLSST